MSVPQPGMRGEVFPSFIVFSLKRTRKGPWHGHPECVWGWGWPGTHVVILRTSFMLVNGSELSGQRRRQGAKMMASALGDMRFTSSSRATLRSERQLGRGGQGIPPDPQHGPTSWCRTSREHSPGVGSGASCRDPPSHREWQRALA